MHATKNNSADWDYFSTTSHLSYCNCLGHLIMPTNPPKHHDFNHQTPTKSNTKIWLQDSNKELELTERKRKKCSKVRKKGSSARHVHGKPIKQQANLELQATQELKQPKENDPCHPGCNPYVKTHTQKIQTKIACESEKKNSTTFFFFFPAILGSNIN